MIIDYDSILKFWRSTQQALLYEERATRFDLELPYEGTMLRCQLNKTSDDADHFSLIKHAANRPFYKDPKPVATHDFSNNSTWWEDQGGGANSLAVIAPPLGHAYVMKETHILMDKDFNSNGQDVCLVLWKSLAQQCPAYISGERTAYGSTAPDSALWTPRPASWGEQEVTEWLRVDETDPLNSSKIKYAAIEFRYSDIYELNMKPTETLPIKDGVLSKFAHDPPVWLSYDKNERMEFFTSFDGVVTSPNGVPAVAIAEGFYTYDI